MKNKTKTKENRSLEIETQVNLIHVAIEDFLVSWNQTNRCQVHRKQNIIDVLAMS